MRFHYGSVPESPRFHPEIQGWQPLREPGPWLLQILAVPAAAVLLALDFGVLSLARPAGFPFSGAFSAFSLPGLLAVMLALVALHELIHVACHPGGGLTDSSIIGLWPAKGLCYAHYDGPISRSRSMLVAAAPCLVLALLPALLVAVLSRLGAPAVLLDRLAFVSIFGAVAGCGDLVVILLLLFQVPISATLRNQGWKTYWKTA
jgi:hypothetical protein